MDKRQFLQSSMALGAIYSLPGFDLEPIVSMKGLQVLTAALFVSLSFQIASGQVAIPRVTGAPFTAIWVRAATTRRGPTLSFI
jgi:hypothetical protein